VSASASAQHEHVVVQVHRKEHEEVQVHEHEHNRRRINRRSTLTIHRAGRDASRSFITGCFETHLTHDLRGLSPEQLQVSRSGAEWIGVDRSGSEWIGNGLEWMRVRCGVGSIGSDPSSLIPSVVRHDHIHAPAPTHTHRQA
jgi:hypothetical protein